MPGVGTADGALGAFAENLATHKDGARPAAVIELKGPGTDLDRDRARGRTPVQQCWDDLNALPETPWGGAVGATCPVSCAAHPGPTPASPAEVPNQPRTNSPPQGPI